MFESSSKSNLLRIFSYLEVLGIMCILIMELGKLNLYCSSLIKLCQILISQYYQLIEM